MFRQLVEFQCWGIFLFQPALMAGVLTYEKERESFSLLLLTGMSPMKILFEKYLAGLFPMATLLLLALPLGAISMGYGGVSPQLIASAACVVLSAWLQVGAFSLLCSAWCRTTVGAMLTAYLGAGLAFLAPAIGYSLAVRYVLWGADLRGLEVPDWLWSHWPPEVFARVLAFQETVASAGEPDPSALWARLLVETARLCAPAIISAVVCLLLARVFMVRRALAGGTHERRPARTTRTAVRAPAKFTRWLHSLWPKHTNLPQDDPIAWRESGRSLLGRRGRFFQLTLMAAGLTLALSLFLLGMYPRTAGPERLHHLAILLGVTMVLALTVRSIGALLSEHANQTLDILLTTPLGAKEIIREKVRALNRYWLLLALPLGIVFALEGWSEYQYVRPETMWRDLGHYWICDALVLLVYPPLIIWVSLLLALWLRVRTRAIVGALMVFALWFIAPLTILSLSWPTWRSTQMGLWLSLLSPLGILDANEGGRLAHFSRNPQRHGRWILSWDEPWVPIVYNFVVYALLLIAARWICLRMAEPWLHRGGRR